MLPAIFSVFSDIGPTATVAILTIFLFGGLVKGGLGFGLPLVTISALPLVVPIDLALGINSVVLPLANVFQYVQARMMRETIVRFWPVLIGLVIGVPIGAALVSAIDKRLLLACLGVFVMIFVALTALNPRFRIPDHLARPVGGLTGVIAGFVGALTTTIGPIFAVYMVGIGAERRVMVSAFGLFFLFSGILIAGSFWTIGILDAGRAAVAVICLPIALIGMWIGNRLADRLTADGFRRLILVILFGLGANMVLRAWFGG